MRKTITAAAGLAAAALCLAGCGGHKARADESAAENSPQFRQAQAIVTKCLSEHEGFTKSDRLAAEKCIAGNGSSAKLEACAESAAVKDHLLLTSAERKSWETTGLPDCVVSVRG